MITRNLLLCALLVKVQGWTTAPVHHDECSVVKGSCSRRMAVQRAQRGWHVLFSSLPASVRSLEEMPVKEIQQTVNPAQAARPTNTTSSVVEPTSRLGWEARARQLAAFVERHGHARVPKRYSINPGLGNWVNKQRQHYRNYYAGAKPCSLTEARIDLLNGLGFCWNARGNKYVINTAAGETVVPDGQNECVSAVWWERLEELRRSTHQQREKDATPFVASLPRHSSLGAWLYRQRQSYSQGTLTTEQVRALDEVAGGSRMVWTATRRDWQWQVRFQELVEYKTEHGDCCVPISHENKQLAHWVSNQRKQYNLLMGNTKRSSNKKVSALTQDRLERLEMIGFVWDRWEYEFSQKQVREE